MGIDTSTKHRSIALIESGNLVFEYDDYVAKNHSSSLVPSLQRLFEESDIDLSHVETIAVTIGPGMFTSLRVGVATAKGLSLAIGRSVMGISTLDAIAWNVPFSQYPVCTLMDARKHEVFAALYRYTDNNFVKVERERVIKPEVLLEDMKEKTVFIGDGAEKYKDLIVAWLGENAQFVPCHLNRPRASHVAFLAYVSLAEGLTSYHADSCLMYLRASDAELKCG
ncbi:MAG: tRNA (adenosine(37)-N6)-threonylcarbamoyltransferase complex dimerization subunit type 1 TsaB [Thermodesulfobacteriota bacterium]|nr:tRNA (adenosine(37)-N6)-threonylcarbamoyltransferase complex dimerization subunit type 1 TsaB [Thermodesulfobacteriota bacterium]